MTRTPDGADALLDVRGLSIRYQGASSRPAVSNFDFDIRPSETLAIVGESGCGKSTSALALLRLLPQTAQIGGRALFRGQDILTLPRLDLEAIRGNGIGMIFQEPMTSLNPVYTVGYQIAEVLHRHTRISGAAAKARVLDLLDQVGIQQPGRRINAYPHELSGGQRQRVMIAMAIVCNPKLLIADEPTTALDATVQKRILELLDRLRRDLSMSLLLISHDLPLVSRWSDRVIVMHHGEKMEELAAVDLLGHSRHPYTRGLANTSLRISDKRHYSNSRLAEIQASEDGDGFRFDLRTPAMPTSSQPVSGGFPVLDVSGLTVEYDGAYGRVRAVSDVTLKVGAGETLGIVGESGSGKSSLSRAIVKLVPVTAGRVLLNGIDVMQLRGRRLRSARRHVQMIFQDPYASLNPRHRIGEVLASVLEAHGVSSEDERRDRIRATLNQVGLKYDVVERYPHEFSGGQRQRISIARALVLRPSLVICDEPVSSLDVSVRAQVLNLLADLKQELGMSYIFISHDIAVVQYISDRIAVMKDGEVVESGDWGSVIASPSHDFTRQMIAASN